MTHLRSRLRRQGLVARQVPARAADRARRHGVGLGGAARVARHAGRHQVHRGGVRRTARRRAAASTRKRRPRRPSSRSTRSRSTTTASPTTASRTSSWSCSPASRSTSASSASDRITLQDTARILQQVCRGLARAHERGIIHRDLKPENIFIVRNTDDDEEIAKVLDFGIAKIQDGPDSPGITSSTKTGAVLGTPFYMSPEQARGLRNVDHRTDVWSLGVIAFKCVTGRLPFDGESVGDLLVKICTAPVPVPSHAVPGLAAGVRRVVHARARARAGAALRRPSPSSPTRSPSRRASPRAARALRSARRADVGHGRWRPPPAPRSDAVGRTRPVTASGAGPTGRNGQSTGSRTPHPAGMTAAPFTSSQPAPGVGTSTLKWVLVRALARLVDRRGHRRGVAFVALKKPARRRPRRRPASRRSPRRTSRRRPSRERRQRPPTPASAAASSESPTLADPADAARRREAGSRRQAHRGTPGTKPSRRPPPSGGAARRGGASAPDAGNAAAVLRRTQAIAAAAPPPTAHREEARRQNDPGY